MEGLCCFSILIIQRPVKCWRSNREHNEGELFALVSSGFNIQKSYCSSRWFREDTPPTTYNCGPISPRSFRRVRELEWGECRYPYVVDNYDNYHSLPQNNVLPPFRPRNQRERELG